MNLKVSQAQAFVILSMQQGAVLYQSIDKTWMEMDNQSRSVHPRTLTSLVSIGMVKVVSRSSKVGTKYALTSVGRKLVPMKS